jgi:hypothetical protein
MPPEALRILRTLHAQNRHRDCAALALRCLSSVDGDETTPASGAVGPETATNDGEPAGTRAADTHHPTTIDVAAIDAAATAAAARAMAREPLHRAALALYAGLALDALARAAPLRSAAAAARAARAAALLRDAAAALRPAYRSADGGGRGSGREERDRDGGSGEGGAARVLETRREAGKAADRLARVERFRRDVAEFVGALDALALSAERWRDGVLEWQERHGVVVGKDELAAAANDLHGSLW